MDLLLQRLVDELVTQHGCHTVLLYGSRARGDATEASDYDLLGVRRSGRAFRIARKEDSKYVDIFVKPEKELRRVGEEHLYMSGAEALYDRAGFGKRLLKKLATAKRAKYKPLPPDEIEVRRVWLHKMLDRTLIGDLEGHYRRAWLLEALLVEYFNVRKLRYAGSKNAFRWLAERDKGTHRLFEKALARPTDRAALKRLVERVSERKS